MSNYNKPSYSFLNVYNDLSAYAGDTGATGPPGSNGATGDTGPTGPPGTPAPGVSSMQPLVEGIAYGETSTMGRTLLGYGVDNTSNNIGLWCSSVGTPQQISNSSSSITSFFDTTVLSTQMQNGIYSGQGGSLINSNFSNSIFAQRNCTIENQTDWTQNLMMVYDFTANPNDSITRSIALMTGQFVTDTQIDQGILIGDMNRMDAPGVVDVICIRAPGSLGTLTMADNSAYFGNGQVSQVMAAGDFLMETYNRYYVKTIPPGTGAETEYVTYDSFTGELTINPIPTPVSYTLPVKLPTVLGGQYGISSLGNASDVNGRNSFNNYSAGPVQLTGVSSVGSSQFQVNNPGLTSFTNDIFLGRTHSFNSVQSVSDTLLAANIVTGANISQITSSNIIVPKAGSLTFTYAGAVTGCNIISSGAVSCVSDPLYSTVLSSGGSVTPAGSNLVLACNQGAGAISMAGSGNSIVFSAGNSVTYNWPVGVSNSCVISNGTSTITPSASNQLCANHTTLRMANINAVGIADINTTPMAYNSTTGLISPTLSSLLSRVYRAVGTTTAAGQVTFTPGGSINPTTVGYSFTATVRNASTTVAYTAQVVAVTATSVTVQVFNSVTVVLASPSMTASGAGIIVHFQMSY